MLNTVLIVGAVFLIIAAFLIFRLQSLVSAIRGTKKADEVDTSSNKYNALGLLIFFIVGMGLFVWYSIDASSEFLPEAASIHGKEIDQLFWITMGILIFVFVLTHVLMFFFAYRYQYKAGAKALFYPDNNKLEIVWTAIPAVVLSVLVFSGWKVWTDITNDVPEDHVQLEIVGKQFNWILRYPGEDQQLGNYNFRKIDATNTVGIDFTDRGAFDDFIPREIHIPVDRNILFRIRARDVLHSVFAPHFRLKMDAVPGMPTRFWFTPTKTTAEMREELLAAAGDDPEKIEKAENFNYEIACTEVCGRGHFSMRLVVVVEEEAEYQAWLDDQKSFLSRNPDYLTAVPEELRPLAIQQIDDPEKVKEILAREAEQLKDVPVASVK